MTADSAALAPPSTSARLQRTTENPEATATVGQFE